MKLLLRVGYYTNTIRIIEGQLEISKTINFNAVLYAISGITIHSDFNFLRMLFLKWGISFFKKMPIN